MSYGKITITLMIAFFLLILTYLVGCACHSPCRVPPESRRQICLDIKRQLIFYNSDPNHYYASWNSPTRMAMLLRRYRQFDCENVLRECPLAPALEQGQ